MKDNNLREDQVQIPAGAAMLEGTLSLPKGAQGVVVFAHGSGSSRHSPRNRFVAQVLREAQLGTLLMDLLTLEEEAIDQQTRHLRFDIDLLADRLVSATDWLTQRPETHSMRIGYFGASTGAGAALVAAARRAERVYAIVSRGGRPDLAGPALAEVCAPTLLIVGGNDPVVLELNRQAMEALRCATRLEIIPGATHLFEEPGALEAVAQLARQWFLRHLTSAGQPEAPLQPPNEQQLAGQP